VDSLRWQQTDHIVERANLHVTETQLTVEHVSERTHSVIHVVIAEEAEASDGEKPPLGCGVVCARQCQVQNT
jgi:hypothetical protein